MLCLPQLMQIPVLQICLCKHLVLVASLSCCCCCNWFACGFGIQRICCSMTMDVRNFSLKLILVILTAEPLLLWGEFFFNALRIRQWPEVQILSHETRAILACPCVFWLAQRAKKCGTNHLPPATACWGWLDFNIKPYLDLAFNALYQT